MAGTLPLSTLEGIWIYVRLYLSFNLNTDKIETFHLLVYLIEVFKGLLQNYHLSGFCIISYLNLIEVSTKDTYSPFSLLPSQ